jgi:hypothetical protein
MTVYDGIFAVQTFLTSCHTLMITDEKKRLRFVADIWAYKFVRKHCS